MAISQEDIQQVLNAIKAESQGAEEYDRTEVSLITRIADEYCTPAFIDGLRKQIKEGGGDESDIQPADPV